MKITDEIKQMQHVELDMLVEVDRICNENRLKYYLGYGTVLGAVRHKGFIPWDTDIDILVDIDSYNRFCNIIQQEIADRYFFASIDTDKTYEELFARVALKNEFHHTIHIDIFPIVGVPKSELGRRLFSIAAYLTYRCFFVKKVDVSINYRNNMRKKIIALAAKLLLIPLPAKLFVCIFKKLSVAFAIEESDTVCNFCGSYGYKELIPKAYLDEPVKMMFEGHELFLPREWHKYLTHFYGDYMTPRRV